ncbi:MAG: BamA/TamA family outer membrane protein [bacterium]|nr:BamA/TamA family outer membrane protein [bacterium]
MPESIIKSGLLLLFGLLLAAGPAAAMPKTTGADQVVRERDPERVLYLEDLELSGTRKTRKAVVLHLLGLEIGREVSLSELAAGRRRLLDSGFFSEVRFSTRPGSERAHIVIVLDLRERYKPYLDTGVGFRDPEGWYLTAVGLRLENPIGLGGRLGARLRFGFRVVGTELDWRIPLNLGQDLSLDLGLDNYEDQTIWYEEQPGWRGLHHEFRQKVRHVEGRVMILWRPLQRLTLEGGFVGGRLTAADEGTNKSLDRPVRYADMPMELQRWNGGLDLNAWQIGLTLGEGGMEGRPGRSLHLQGRLYSDLFGSEATYPRLTLTCRSTMILSSGHSLGLGLRSGYVGDDAPCYERFKLGGSYSLRGFRDHSLSPVQGHKSFWTLSSEYRFRLLQGDHGKPRLTGLVFVDTGGGRLAADTIATDIDYEQLQIGAGYGVRLALPWLGVVGLDVGFPVTSGVTGDAVWFYLTLGYSF